MSMSSVPHHNERREWTRLLLKVFFIAVFYDSAIHLNKTHAEVYSYRVFLSLELLSALTGTAATLHPPSFSAANVRKGAKTKVLLPSRYTLVWNQFTVEVNGLQDCL